MGIRIASPKPDQCSSCFNTADRYVDFDAAFDSGSFTNHLGGLVHVEGTDDLYLCEACVTHAAEVLDFKPGLHARHLEEIRRLRADVEHWKSVAQQGVSDLNERVKAVA